MRRRKPLRASKPVNVQSAKAKARRLDERAWSELIRARAGWRCEYPGCVVRETVDVRLQAHHVLQKSVRPDLRLEPRNGRALCSVHHRVVHDRPTTARELGLLGWSTDDLGELERTWSAAVLYFERVPRGES